MKVFEYWGAAEPYACFSTPEANQALWSRSLHGDSKAAGWIALDLHPSEEYPGVPMPLGPIGDVTTVNSTIKNCVWGPRARAALEPHVSRFGEFLPLRCKQADWVLFNVTRKIDALDEAASELIYVNDPHPKVMRFVRMVFKRQALEGELIFRIPQRGGGDIFVTDRFADLVKQHGLVGFDLKLVWDSEAPETK